MRVVLLTRRLIAAGAERQAVVAAKSLHQRGHEVTVALFYPGGILEAELRAAGIPIHHLGKKGRWSLLAPLFSLIRLVHANRTDVVYSFLPGDNLATVPLKVLFPRLRVLWGVHSADRSKSTHDAFSRTQHVIEAALSFVPDGIVAVSEEARMHAIRRGTAARRMSVVPNAVDTDEFVPSPDAAHAFRREIGAAADAPLIGIVGRIVPVKDHALFLRAAAEFLRKRPDCRFVIAGDGPAEYVRSLRALVQDLEIGQAVSWIEPRSDLRGLYTALDLLTLCSVSESFGNVIAEAMSCGTRCVATNVGMASEIIGDTGIVLHDREPEAMAAAWEQLLSTTGAGMATRTRIVSRFSAGHAADLLEGVMRG